MSNRVTFDFDSYVWFNQRKAVRANGSNSLFYRALKIITKILENRATKLSWLYNQFWLEKSDGNGLVAWGIRYRIPKRPGESDNNYRNRILLDRLFKLSVPSVSTKLKALAVMTGLSRSQIQYINLFNNDFGRNTFRMGDEISLPMMSRKYIIYRYRFYIPILPESFDRNELSSSLENVNVGGNVPEIWEDQGDFDPFVMGGSLTGKMVSRRSDRTREFLVY